MSLRNFSSARMRSWARFWFSRVTPVMSTSAIAMSASEESHGEGTATRAGRTKVAMRPTGDIQLSVTRATVAPCRAAASANWMISAW